jgi:hypothetical protein
MGEGSKPELVTVTLLTRGTRNHGGPTVSSGRGSSGSGRPIVIENVITLDGQVIEIFTKGTIIKIGSIK